MPRSDGVENGGYASFARRIIRALGHRVGRGDVADLADLVALQSELTAAIDDAVRGLRADPVSPASWQQIADQLGVTRQAAMKRWGHVGGIRRAGGQPSALR